MTKESKIDGKQIEESVKDKPTVIVLVCIVMIPDEENEGKEIPWTVHSVFPDRQEALRSAFFDLLCRTAKPTHLYVVQRDGMTVQETLLYNEKQIAEAYGKFIEKPFTKI